MLKRLVVVSAAVLAVTVALVGPGLGASTPTTHLRARLTPAEQVPPPTVPSLTSTGTWTATLRRGKLSWKLTYAGLSSKALAAHVHLGARGHGHGAVLILICSPCRSGTAGFASITTVERRILLAGAAYVDIHTADNRSGEVRGQVRQVR